MNSIEKLYVFIVASKRYFCYCNALRKYTITENRTSFCIRIDGFISLVCSMFSIAPLEPVIRGRKFD